MVIILYHGQHRMGLLRSRKSVIGGGGNALGGLRPDLGKDFEGGVPASRLIVNDFSCVTRFFYSSGLVTAVARYSLK